MMATTHALVGLVVGGVVATLAPDLGAALLFAGVTGGVFPDLDLYASHRRTLHFPVVFSVAAALAAVAALAWPTVATVTGATFLSAAALHSASDALGGGLELRPWRATSERAVYDHARGRWLRPRRLIRYDGAPEDFLVVCVLAIPSVYLVHGVHPAAVPGIAVLVAVSGAYTLVRRRLPDLAEAGVDLVPDRLQPHVPDRFFENR